jgi:signal peptidase I
MQPLSQDSYSTVALDLLGQGLHSGNAIRLVVNGSSMLPLLRPGDAVWLEAIDPAALQPGDLVTIRQQNILLTHRLIVVGPSSWQTKGDNNRLADPPLGAEAILGRSVSLERGDALIFLQDGCWPLANRLLGRIGRLHHRLAQSGRWRPTAHAPTYIQELAVRMLVRFVVAVALRL